MNARKDSGVTALHYACVAHGRLETARFLLDHGAALGAKDEHNDTPPHWACFSNNLNAVKELVQRGADIFTEGEDKATPFDQAAVRTTEVADYLLEQYKDKVWKQEGGLSLHAILGGATNPENNKVQLPIGTVTVDQLLALLLSIHEQDTDSIHIQDSNRALPIHIACHANAPMKVLCFCVEKDEATLHMMDSVGARPIHNACRGGASLEKFKYLIKKGGVGTLCARDNQCALPLHVTCQSKPSVDVVKYMLKLYPISVSEKMNLGALPLMLVGLACETSASESVLQVLLTAHPEALDKMNAYYYILSKHNLSIISALDYL